MSSEKKVARPTLLYDGNTAEQIASFLDMGSLRNLANTCKDSQKLLDNKHLLLSCFVQCHEHPYLPFEVVHSWKPVNNTGALAQKLAAHYTQPASSTRVLKTITAPATLDFTGHALYPKLAVDTSDHNLKPLDLLLLSRLRLPSDIEEFMCKNLDARIAIDSPLSIQLTAYVRPATHPAVSCISCLRYVGLAKRDFLCSECMFLYPDLRYQPTEHERKQIALVQNKARISELWQRLVMPAEQFEQLYAQCETELKDPLTPKQLFLLMLEWMRRLSCLDMSQACRLADLLLEKQYRAQGTLPTVWGRVIFGSMIWNPAVDPTSATNDPYTLANAPYDELDGCDVTGVVFGLRDWQRSISLEQLEEVVNHPDPQHRVQFQRQNRLQPQPSYLARSYISRQ